MTEFCVSTTKLFGVPTPQCLAGPNILDLFFEDFVNLTSTWISPKPATTLKSLVVGSLISAASSFFNSPHLSLCPSSSQFSQFSVLTVLPVVHWATADCHYSLQLRPMLAGLRWAARVARTSRSKPSIYRIQIQKYKNTKIQKYKNTNTNIQMSY